MFTLYQRRLDPKIWQTASGGLFFGSVKKGAPRIFCIMDDEDWEEENSSGHDDDDKQQEDLSDLATTAIQLFNTNPLQGIMKATDIFFWWAAQHCKKDKKQRHRPHDNAVRQSKITLCQDFLQELEAIGRCFDYRDKSFRNCECVKKLSNDDIRDGSIFLVELVNQEKCMCGTQLKGMLAAANQNSVTKTQLRKKFWQKHIPAAAIDGAQPDFQLPFGNQPNVCRQAFPFLFSLKPNTKWKTLRKSLKNNGLGPIIHGLTGNINGGATSAMTQCEPDLCEFFEALAIAHGEPQATRLVRTKTKTGLRDTEVDLVELPSALTKRGIYQRFCYKCGYKLKTDAMGSYPKLLDYPAPNDFDEVFWLPGTAPLPVCS